jgi:hypothetical protein
VSDLEEEANAGDIAASVASSDHTSTSASPTKRTQRTKWQNLRSLPNMHVGLHLADNVYEYAHVMNCNVFSGELRHA